jgi:hypothetical protein
MFKGRSLALPGRDQFVVNEKQGSGSGHCDELALYVRPTTALIDLDADDIDRQLHRCRDYSNWH